MSQIFSDILYVWMQWNAVCSTMCMKWSCNSVSWGVKLCNLFLTLPPIKYANAELSSCPAGVVTKRCPQCHLVCQFATVNTTTSHSHFYKAACMWHVPHAMPSEVGMNPWPCQNTFDLEVGTFNSLFWFLMLDKQCKTNEVTTCY